MKKKAKGESGMVTDVLFIYLKTILHRCLI